MGSESESGNSATFITSKWEVRWERKPVQRKTGKTDIYYYEEGNTDRLRSLIEIERYCDRRNIRYDPNLFYFSSFNLYSDIIPVVSITDGQ